MKSAEANHDRQCYQPTRQISGSPGEQSRACVSFISLPLRRREACLTRRALLAALREAEFDQWQASGGDYLNHAYQASL